LAEDLLKFDVKLNTYLDTQSIEMEMEALGNTLKKFQEQASAISRYTMDATDETLKAGEGVFTITKNLEGQSRALLAELKLRRTLNMEVESLAATEAEISATVRDIMQDTDRVGKLTEVQFEELNRVAKRMGTFKSELLEATSLAGKLGKGFEALGAKGLGKLISSFKTIHGVIVLAAEALKGWLKLEDELSQAQLRQYGATADTTEAVLRLSAEYGILRKTGIATAQALAKANVGLDDADFNILAGEIGRVHEATGFSVESMAEFGKALQISGQDVHQINRSLANFSYVAQQFGLDAGEAGAVMKATAGEALRLTRAFGSEAVVAHGKAMAYLAAQAKRYGMSIAGVTKMMDTSMDAAIKYSMILGENRMFKSPAENAMALQMRIGEITKRFHGLMVKADGITAQPPWMLDKIVGETMGNAIRQAAEDFENFGGTQAEWEAHVTALQKKRMTAEKLVADQREASMKAWQALVASLDSGLTSLLGLLSPLFYILEQLAKGFLYLQEISNGWFGKIVIALTLGAFLFKKFIAIVALGGGIFGKFGAMLSGAFTSVAGPVKSKGIAFSLKILGKGLYSFFARIAKAPWMGIIKLGVIVVALLALAIGTAKLASYLDVTLLDTAMSLVAFAGAIWILSNVGKKIDLAGVGQVALATGVLALGLLAIAWAVKIAGGGTSLIEGAIAMVGLQIAFAYTLGVLGKAGHAAAKDIAGLAMLALATTIFGLGLLVMAWAISIMKDPWALLPLALGVLAFVIIMGVVGALATTVGAAIIAGAIILAIGFAALGVGLLIFAAAMAALGGPEALIPMGEGLVSLLTSLSVVAMAALAVGVPLIIGSIFLGIGIGFLVAALAPLNRISADVGDKMVGIGEGVRALIGSTDGAFGFWWNSDYIADGIEIIADSIKDNLPGIKNAGITELMGFMDIVTNTPKSAMQQFADNFENMLKTMASASEKYGDKIGHSMGGAISSFSALTADRRQASFLERIFGIGSTTAVVAQETKKNEQSWWEKILFGVENDETGNETVEQLKALNEKMEKITAAIGGGAIASEILAQLREWLPEIAASDITNRKTTSW
jgi:hypothetical protein